MRKTDNPLLTGIFSGVSVCQYVYIGFYVQHQQQVAAAVERAKQVTMQELNAIIGVIIFRNMASSICLPQYHCCVLLCDVLVAHY